MRIALWQMLAALSALLFGTSTVGSIAPAAASPQDYTSGGGVSTFPLAASVGAAVLISKNPGRLQRVLVTTSAAHNWTFYDSNDATKTGTIIGYVPNSTAVGTVLDFQMPAALGIVAVPDAAGTACTVSFN